MTADGIDTEHDGIARPTETLAAAEADYYAHRTEQKHPHVVAALAAVASDVGAIAKSRKGPDKQGGYAYRGIQDVLNALHRPLAEHGVVIVPRVVESTLTPLDRPGWHKVTLTTEFDLYGPNGPTDVITCRITADGDDNADKGYGKALSYCYKSMAAQVFSLPTEDVSLDNEADTEQAPPGPAYVLAGTQAHTDLLTVIATVADDGHRAELAAFCKRIGAAPKSGAGLTVEKAEMIASLALDLTETEAG